MNLAGILAYLTLLAAAPLLAYATWRLWRLWRLWRNPVTRVQGIAVTVVLVHTLVFGFLFLNNDQPIPPLDTGATKIIARLIEFGGGLVVALTALWLFPHPGRRRP